VLDAGGGPDDEERELLLAAAAALLARNTETWYGKHTVAAATRDATGRLHTAVNVPHFTGELCAELVLLRARPFLAKEFSPW
jgi:cytidine deaminase